MWLVPLQPQAGSRLTWGQNTTAMKPPPVHISAHPPSAESKY